MQISNVTYNFHQNSDDSNHYLAGAAHLDRLWPRAQGSYSEKEKHIPYLVLDHTEGRGLSITHELQKFYPNRAWAQVTLLAPVHPIPPFSLKGQDLRRGRHIPAAKHIKISNYWPDFQWQIHAILMKTNSMGIKKEYLHDACCGHRTDFTLHSMALQYKCLKWSIIPGPSQTNKVFQTMDNFQFTLFSSITKNLGSWRTFPDLGKCTVSPLILKQDKNGNKRSWW